MALGALAFLPLPAAAQSLVSACWESGDCTGCDFITLFVNIAQWVLSVVSAVAMLMVVIGGLMWIISAGNAERVQRGQQILIGAVIGVALVLSGYLIVNFAIASLLGQDSSGDPPQLFGEDWSTYCESGTAPNNYYASDCSAEGVDDGDPCKVSGQCALEGACVCESGACVNICVAEVTVGGQGGECLDTSQEQSDCTDKSGNVVDRGNFCADPDQICCVGASS